MARGMDYSLFTSKNTNSYVWGDKDGVFGRWPISIIEGATGAKGANGVGYKFTDNSAATSDYLLVPGEVAYIDYASATSVPLNIETEEGFYELIVLGDQTVTNGTTADITLSPNNTSTASDAIYRSEVYTPVDPTAGRSAVTGTFVQQGTGLSTFYMGDGLLLRLDMAISTMTKSKTVKTDILRRHANGTVLRFVVMENWKNTSTAWVSLGTITFPFAQSGKIIVRRIL